MVCPAAVFLTSALALLPVFALVGCKKKAESPPADPGATAETPSPGAPSPLGTPKEDSPKDEGKKEKSEDSKDKTQSVSKTEKTDLTSLNMQKIIAQTRAEMALKEKNDAGKDRSVDLGPEGNNAVGASQYAAPKPLPETM
ncbi:hypothetical protein L596_014233 [Steinernema carpocapsae]|uniref:Uncharacterized protein n=1 Tax=Steinernema carpocapsae TaxID=34508 RepID=A0A4U5NBV1_STECR|nr:hypothetical protein L596_014233 [Steinernema carpocapsae]